MSQLPASGGFSLGSASASSTAAVEFGLLNPRQRQRLLDVQISEQLQNVENMLGHIPADETIQHAWVVQTELFEGNINQTWWFQRLSLFMCGSDTPTHSFR